MEHENDAFQKGNFQGCTSALVAPQQIFSMSDKSLGAKTTEIDLPPCEVGGKLREGEILHHPAPHKTHQPDLKNEFCSHT